MRTDAAFSTWPEADRARLRAAPAVIAFGALEQHGPHLPLSTDTLTATWLAEQVADAVDGWLLPPIPLGDTAANDAFPGTVSLSFDTVRAIALDVCRSLRRSGFSCLIVVNGDYGNRAPLHVAAREAARPIGLPMLVLDYPGLDEAAAEICESSPAAPGFYHADEVETSIVLALRPDLVDLDRAEPVYPALPSTLGATPTDFAALTPTGVLGDPRRADARKGELLLAALAERCVAIATAFVAGVSDRDASVKSS